MNPLLQKKLDELQSAKDYECWYLVKQTAAFDILCYLVSFLQEFQSKKPSENLQAFLEKCAAELNASKPDIKIQNNYRTLRGAVFFGLITMPSSGKYEDAVITETFEEINRRCDGVFERTELYKDIIQRQIEKMYLSSTIDEECNGVRKNFRLYPVMFLYKVLLELGRSTGSCRVSMAEYHYLVTTAKTFEDFLETLLLIRLFREEPSAKDKFEQYRQKFDNRFFQALKQLPTLTFEKDSIELKPEFVDEVAKKIFLFERQPNIFADENYLDFLGSTRSLFDHDELENKSGNSAPIVQTNNSDRLKGGANILLYGVPGCGKSFIVTNKYCKDAHSVERVVFHPDYTYGDFVGQILPITDAESGKIRYEFSAGPFTRILSAAYNDPGKKYCLIIEEINRGNAPAIFGDIFQMLDRDEDGNGAYEITNADIAAKVYLYGEKTNKVRLPSNLYIFATMNTSDQNVFTLDTAFQRRWNMRMVENDVFQSKLAEKRILDTTVTWATFANTINNLILSTNAGMASSEDKRLGAYFVTEKDLIFYTDKNGLTQEEADDRNHSFPEKVLKYLWDDAFKFSRDEIFSSDYDSLEGLIKAFETARGDDRFRIFIDNIFELDQGK